MLKLARILLLAITLLIAKTGNAQQYKTTTSDLSSGRAILRSGTDTYNLKDSLKFNGNRPITLPQLAGVNPGTSNSMQDFLNALFYPSQPPTATISGGVQFERSATGTTPVTVNWTAGRQAATEQLSTIIVDGESKSFSQPSAPGSVNGTHNLTLTNNTNKTVTITVTTTDGKSASASTVYSWLDKRYWGRTSAISPSSSEILAATGGGNQLSGSRNGTFTITASGSNRVFYAYPSNLGDLISINIGGLESLASFTKTVLSFTNASGYTQNYNVYTSNNETGGNVTAAIQ